MPVTCVLPAVARDTECPADAAGREYDGFANEHLESPAIAIISERAGNPVSVLEQRNDRAFHVHIDRLMNGVILECANDFQSGAIADVREARIFVSAEIALKDPAVSGSVEHRAEGFELVHAIRRFLRVELRHPPVIEVLASTHRVREVNLP